MNLTNSAIIRNIQFFSCLGDVQTKIYLIGNFWKMLTYWTWKHWGLWWRRGRENELPFSVPLFGPLFHKRHIYTLQPRDMAITNGAWWGFWWADYILLENQNESRHQLPLLFFSVYSVWIILQHLLGFFVGGGHWWWWLQLYIDLAWTRMHLWGSPFVVCQAFCVRVC